MRNARQTLPRGLYLISPEVDSVAALRAAVGPVLAHASMIQSRCKSKVPGEPLRQAQWLRAESARLGIPLIVNDDVALAVAVSAEGVHLGRDDGAIAHAREALGASAWIGASCYADFARAVEAWQAGADYVAFGAVFASPTKPLAATAPLDLFQRARAAGMHSVAIGGITPETMDAVVGAGADMAAVISGIYAADDPARAAAMCAAAFKPR